MLFTEVLMLGHLAPPITAIQGLYNLRMSQFLALMQMKTETCLLIMMKLFLQGLPRQVQGSVYNSQGLYTVVQRTTGDTT